MLLIYPFLLLQDDVITANEYDSSVAQGDLDHDAVTKVSFYCLLIIISFNVSNFLFCGFYGILGFFFHRSLVVIAEDAYVA